MIPAYGDGEQWLIDEGFLVLDIGGGVARFSMQVSQDAVDDK